jgi:hypothetical protein
MSQFAAVHIRSIVVFQQILGRSRGDCSWITAITGQSLPFSLCLLRLVRVELPEVCDDLGEPSGEAVEVTARTVG